MEFHLYTDGACKGNNSTDKSKAFGGWGYYLYSTDDQYEQSNYGGAVPTTNNIMEMTAMIEGMQDFVQLLQDEKLAESRASLHIYTDSKYVYSGLTDWIKGWKKNGWKTASKKPVLNVELWKQLDILYQNLVKGLKSCKITHVYGHAGNPGNEKADELANQGVDFIKSQDN